MNVSILSERRVFAPYGIFGGENGSKGINLLKQEGGKKIINLGGKNNIDLLAGDTIVIMTPGGGGYGKYSDREEKKLK